MTAGPGADAATELAGKTILVTGASKGIGAAIVASVGAAGAHVVAHYGSDEEGARAATRGIAAERRLLVAADLARAGEPERLWREALAWRGRVDVLVNNAAVMLEAPLEGDDAAWARVWDESLRVNVRAPAELMRLAVRHFVECGGGSLITLSSWAAQRGSGSAALAVYASTKAAVRSLTQTIARNYARQGVLAYVVAPGIVRTRMSEQFAASTGGEDAVTATLAMGEWVPPPELGALVAFLATGRCRHLTGATLDVNGATYVR